jgi:hypothetical protein
MGSRFVIHLDDELAAKTHVQLTQPSLGSSAQDHTAQTTGDAGIYISRVI